MYFLAQALSDFPRIEPYAISGHTPDVDGLYARADLFVSSTCKCVWNGVKTQLKEQYHEMRVCEIHI